MQSEALFGPQSKSINNNAPQLFSKENSTNFCSRSWEIRFKSFSNFARQINVTLVEVWWRKKREFSLHHWNLSRPRLVKVRFSPTIVGISVCLSSVNFVIMCDCARQNLHWDTLSQSLRVHKSSEHSKCVLYLSWKWNCHFYCCLLEAPFVVVYSVATRRRSQRELVGNYCI